MSATDTRPEPLVPDLDGLDDRAVRAWTESMAVRPLDGARYAVDSGSGATYVVDLGERTCTCPDHAIRGARCKHLRRVAVEVTRGRAPPPGHERDRCASCDRPAFVPEDAPSLCRDCRLDPGDPVRDRETGDLLIVDRVTTDRADEVTVAEHDAGSGDAGAHTVAEHPTNRQYAPGDIVIEAIYPFSAPAGEEPKRYAFPRRRLVRR
jgi:hypothetical protein